MTISDAPAALATKHMISVASQTKSFSGSYLLYRKVGQKLGRAGGKDQKRTPRFRHPTFAAAEAEAQRLLTAMPESTFVILQEVARVKLKAAEPTTNVRPMYGTALDKCNIDRVTAFCDWLDTVPPSPPFHQHPDFARFDDLTNEDMDAAEIEMRRRASVNAADADTLAKEQERRR